MRNSKPPQQKAKWCGKIYLQQGFAFDWHYDLLYAASIAMTGIAQAHAILGDGMGAYATLQDQFRLKSIADGFGFSIGALVSQTMEASFWQTVRMGAALNVWTAGQLEEFSRQAAESNPVERARIGLQEELEAMQYLESRPEILAKNLRDAAESPDGRSSYERWVNQLRMRLTTPSQIQDTMSIRGADIADAIERLDGEARRVGPLPDGSRGLLVDFHQQLGWGGEIYFHLLDGQIWTANSRSNGALALDRAQKAVAFQEETRLALALESHRLATGSYPDSLDALSSSFSGRPVVDPYTGGPLRYERGSDGSFKIWSPGPDGRDDGGQRDSDIVTVQPPAVAKTK